jgi:hypothetical protein
MSLASLKGLGNPSLESVAGNRFRPGAPRPRRDCCGSGEGGGNPPPQSEIFIGTFIHREVVGAEHSIDSETSHQKRHTALPL